MKIISLITRRKQLKTQKSFFDYSSGERKKIIKKASQEAIKKQRHLMREYNLLFCKSNFK